MKRIFSTLKEKWPEYLLESIVIVASILLAIWLENLNSDYNKRKEEHILLIDLKSDLEKTVSEFIDDTMDNRQSIENLRKIELYIRQDLDYAAELDTCFGDLLGWSSPYIITSAYKSLQSKGVELIKNRKLRNRIVNLYDSELTLLTEDYDKAEWVLYENVMVPFFSENLRSVNDKSTKTARPNDFDKLKRNPELLNDISLSIRIRRIGLSMYKRALTEVNQVVSEIEIELKK